MTITRNEASHPRRAKNSTKGAIIKACIPGIPGQEYSMKMDIHSMIDSSGRFDSVETWERHLAKVKALPASALERGPMIRRARRVIADIRRHTASRKKTD
jgi:hypothetical protein